MQDICCWNVHDLDHNLENGLRSDVSTPIDSPRVTLFDGESNVFFIFHHLQNNKLCKLTRFEFLPLTMFRQMVKVMNYNYVQTDGQGHELQLCSDRWSRSWTTTMFREMVKVMNYKSSLFCFYELNLNGGFRPISNRFWLVHQQAIRAYTPHKHTHTRTHMHTYSTLHMHTYSTLNSHRRQCNALHFA